jgi:dTDP-4-dehydrorhamnose reductase
MRTLVFGGAGLLGQAVAAEARARGWPVLALPRGQADVADRGRLDYWVDVFRPDLVVNCAAFTRVDACETEEGQAFAVNGAAVANVAAAAERGGARLLHLSTDYVFDGAASRPYREDAETRPLSIYGRSKLAGEGHALAYARALVVRTSWLFGPGGPNFVATIAAAIDRGQRQLRIVEDQLGAPTYAPFLARALLDLAPLAFSGEAGGKARIVHYRNREPVSWYSFATAIARLWPGPHGTVEVVPVATAELSRPAPRPAFSVLDVARCEANLGRRVELWEWGLAEYLSWIRGGRSR